MKQKKLIILTLITIIALIIVFSVEGDVSTTATKVTYSCNGSTTQFTFSFPIISTSDLTVVMRNTTTGTESTLTETTDYSVSATNNDYSSGGTVTTVATYASGQTITLLRETPQTQNAVLQDSGVLRVAALEDGVDKLTLLVQQLQEQLDRALIIPKGETLGMELPSSVSRANGYLSFGSTGTPTISTSGFTSSDYTVSSYMENVLDDTSEGVFKATVNLEIGTDVQAYDAELAALATTTSAANKLPYFTGSGTATTADITAFARTVLDDADGDTILTTIGGARYASVTVSNAEIKALAASQKTLVAAPGANKVIHFVGAILILDYGGTNVFTESTDNFAIKYTNASGVAVSDTIEMTGFIDQSADTMTCAVPIKDAIVAASGASNRALVLDNTGDGEIGGNAGNDNTMTVIVHYVVYADGL